MKNIVALCVQARIPSKSLYFLQQYLIFFSSYAIYILGKLWLPLMSRCDVLGLKNVSFHDKNTVYPSRIEFCPHICRVSGSIPDTIHTETMSVIIFKIIVSQGEQGRVSTQDPQGSVSAQNPQDQILSTKEVCPRGTKGRE